jgi:hypothetical protein
MKLDRAHDTLCYLRRKEIGTLNYYWWLCAQLSYDKEVHFVVYIYNHQYDKLDIDYRVLKLSFTYLSKCVKQCSDYRIASNRLRRNNLTI